GVVGRALAFDPSLPLAAGGGSLASSMIRVNHYGAAADGVVVDRCLTALHAALAAV
ncbi:alanine--glyoxylate aminotransferase family protein, partial [Streptomyces sp. 8P21H-1]|nr:alanine--glyoxylate aminotransferase family protein [Streptomyces sp. 8P21H-1]